LDTYAASTSELQKVEAAVKKVNIDSLEQKRRQCLEKLKAGEADLKRFFEIP